MFQKKIIVILIAILAALCFTLTADAAKGGGGCKDRDNDGYFQKAGCGTAVDCNDDDSAINPGAAEVCDSIDNNCDGTVDESCGGCTDNDGDGYGVNGDPSCPAGTDIDCDDSDPSINPGASEVCGDNVDNNCDGDVDEGCGGCVPTASKERDCDCFDNEDNDCDGSIDSLDRDCKRETCDTCYDADGDGWYTCGDDCDDSNPAINPGAPEVCNGIDDDCDGLLPIEEMDVDWDGVSICEGDCDDNNPSRYPGNTEGPFGHPVCSDGIDNDCDNLIDAVDPGCEIPCIDNDGDGFGAPASPSCTYNIEDCDDTDPTINPLGVDLCDGIDRDCNGTTINDDDNDGFGVPASPYCTYNIEDCDDTDPTINPFGVDLCDGIDRDCNGTTINDDDNDGFGVPASPYCTYNIEDCDDTDPTINPLGVDLCDGIDRDCNGTTINDDDNDGFGVPASPYCTYNIEDCDDTDPTINPFGVDLCDGIDRDCNGTTINDNDNDGFGVPASPFCTYNIEDCDDTDPTVCPTCPLLCDGKDNDCDGFLDFPTDEDKDGDGVPACADCNDNDPNRYPGNTEGPYGDPTCIDGIDNDCDFMVDGADPGCAPLSCITKVSPQDGPHIFDLLDPADDSVIATPCSWCHTDVLMGSGTADQRFDCQRCHADPSDTSDPLNGVLKALYPMNSPYGFGTALNVKPHSSTVLGFKYGNWDTECITCHNPHQQEQDNKHGTTYGKLIKEYICFDNPVTALNIEDIVQFTAGSGPGSFADGPPHNENICETCHTLTDSHRRDGSTPSHEDNNNCAICHPHSEGFATSGGIIPDVPHDSIIDCNYCHVGGIYTVPIPDSKCNDCHTPAGYLKGSYPTAPDVLTHSDVNGSGTYVYTNNCVDCHDPMNPQINLSHVRSTIAGSILAGSNIVFTAYSGVGSFADGPPCEENICETCHSITSVHRFDCSTPPHNDGADCTACHTHLDGYSMNF